MFIYFGKLMIWTLNDANKKLIIIKKNKKNYYIKIGQNEVKVKYAEVKMLHFTSIIITDRIR